MCQLHHITIALCLMPTIPDWFHQWAILSLVPRQNCRPTSVDACDDRVIQKAPSLCRHISKHTSQLFVAAKLIHTCTMSTYWHQTVRIMHAASLPPFNSDLVDQKKTRQWNNCVEFLPVLWHCWLGDRKGKEVKFLLHLFSEAWPNMEKLQKKVGWTKMQVCILT